MTSGIKLLNSSFSISIVIIALLNISPIVFCGYLDNLHRSLSLMKGVTKGLLSNEYKMSPVHVGHCDTYSSSSFEDEHVFFMDDYIRQQGGKERVFNKDDQQIIPIEATMLSDMIITKSRIQVNWEQTDVHSYVIDIFKHLKPSDYFHQDVYWKIPFYAPSGSYQINYELYGIPQGDNMNKEDFSSPANQLNYFSEQTMFQQDSQFSDQDLEDIMSVYKEIQDAIIDDTIDHKNESYKDIRYSKVPQELRDRMEKQEKLVGCLTLKFRIEK